MTVFNRLVTREDLVAVAMSVRGVVSCVISEPCTGTVLAVVRGGDYTAVHLAIGAHMLSGWALRLEHAPR